MLRIHNSKWLLLKFIYIYTEAESVFASGNLANGLAYSRICHGESLASLTFSVLKCIKLQTVHQRCPDISMQMSLF